MTKVEDFLSGYNDSIRLRVLKLQTLLRSQLIDIQEEFDQTAKLISYNYGAGYKNVICVILLSKKGVKLGFNHGCDLHDPHKMLQGSGKVHRYVIINSLEDIENDFLKELIADALQLYRQRIRLM